MTVFGSAAHTRRKRLRAANRPPTARRRPAAALAPQWSATALARTARDRDRMAPDRARTALAAALFLATAVGCEPRPAPDGGANGTGGAASSGAASQSIPPSMLAEGGTQTVPPAQEFALDEIGYDFGLEEAPVKVVEFSDYGCGYCRRFHAETFPTLMEEFVNTGVVQWKYVTYVSGMFPNSFPAAFAAECAGEQGLFSEVSRALYDRQSDWKRLDDPSPVFASLAVEAGVDMEEFRACVVEERPRSRIRSGVISGARLGVRGTPSFLVAGRPLVGAQPVSVWRDIIEIAKGLPAAPDSLDEGDAGR